MHLNWRSIDRSPSHGTFYLTHSWMKQRKHGRHKGEIFCLGEWQSLPVSVPKKLVENESVK